MENQKRLNIVHVLLSRGFAGSERSTAESCNQQCQAHEVTLILRHDHRKKGRSVVDHLDSRVKVVIVHARLFTGWLLKRQLFKINPDIIHCHLRRSTRLTARARHPAAAVSTLHITVNGRYFNDMDGIICNARWQLDDIPPSYPGKVFKANNSLVPHRRISAEERDDLRSEFCKDDTNILFGAVGRLHHSKALDTLIQAFKRLPEHKHALLVVFGSGGLESELRKLAIDDKRITFAGFRENIKDWYQVFDVFVCPSRFEPLPRVILEAMDGGVPVIASDTGGCKELVDDYGGLCFETDNVSDLEQALDQAIRNPPTRNRPDLSGHWIDATSNAMLVFYQEVIDAKRSDA